MQLDMKQNNDSNNMMNGDDGDDNTEIESSSSDDEQSKMKKRDKMKMQRSCRISQVVIQIDLFSVRCVFYVSRVVVII